MELAIIAFIAGIVTVLAPCVLPLLPVIVGGSLDTKPSLRKPLVVTASLAASVVVFTLLLKASTLLLGVPLQVWEVFSGLVIGLLGATLAWPRLWEPLAAKLNARASRGLGRAGKNRGIWGEIAAGAALGPVFSSCSPTYAFIVASVIPAAFGVGLLYLVAYVAGLAATLLLIALLGQQLIAKLTWASNPHGWFKRGLGVVFIVVGIFIATGLSKQVEAYLISNGFYDWQTSLERSLNRNVRDTLHNNEF